MFSTTPTRRIPVFCAITPARDATSWAACCGVVTTIVSARGRSWPSEIATSPVPGGMSTTRTSSSPQCTSDRNCSSARCNIGPRHITGWLSSRKKPMDISFKSCLTGGTIILSTSTGFWWMPSTWGMECPYTSASSTPTCLPLCANAMARLAVSVDLPTPPLPLQTARTRVDASRERPFDRSCTPPRNLVVSAWRSSAVITSKPRATRSTPGTSRSTSTTCCWNESRNGQPAIVRAIVTRTSPPSISTPRTMSSSVTGRRSSGSITRSSAFMIRSRLGSFTSLSLAASTSLPPVRADSDPPAPGRRDRPAHRFA